jgi:TonB family protein
VSLRAFLRDPFKVGFVAVLIGVVIILEAVLLLRPRSPQVAAVPPPAPAASAPAIPVPAPAPAPATAPAPAPRETPTFKPLPPETTSAPAPQTPPRASAVVPEPAKPAPRVETPAAKPEGARPEAKPAPRKTESAKAAPRVVEPPPEARPAPAPPPEPAESKPRPAPTLAAVPVSRAAVEFPVAAYAKNIESGTVKARLTIDAEGRVTAVQVLEARPRRYFDEEAARSLKLWRFNAGADNRTYDVEIAFTR